MATLRELFDPRYNELDRFRGQDFNDLAFRRFTDVFVRELDYVDYMRKEAERKRAEIDSMPGDINFGEAYRQSMLRNLERYEQDIETRRAGAFSKALKAVPGDLGTVPVSVSQELQETLRSLAMTPDGQLVDPRGGGPGIWDSETGQVFQKYWEEEGIAKGLGKIALSTITAPIRGAQDVASGKWIDHPLQTGAALTAWTGVGRVGGRLVAGGAAAAGRKGAAAAVGRFGNNPVLGWSGRMSDAMDFSSAGEELFLELVGEGAFEGLGMGGNLARRGFSREAGDIDASQQIDEATGSKTTPDSAQIDLQQGLQQAFEEAARSVEGLDFDPVAAAEEARQRAAGQSRQQARDDYTRLWEGYSPDQTESRGQFYTPPQDPDSRRSFWEQNLSPTEEQARQQDLDSRRAAPQETQAQRVARWNQYIDNMEADERAAAEQQAREQGFIDADDAFTQQQTEQAATEEQAALEQAAREDYRSTFREYYLEQAGGSISLANRLADRHFDEGANSPFQHIHNRIREQLKPLMGGSPSMLEQEAETRLKQELGEKWYNRYRGIPEKTIADRVQESIDAADKIEQAEQTTEFDEDEFVNRYAQRISETFTDDGRMTNESLSVAQEMNKELEELGVTDEADLDRIRQRVSEPIEKELEFADTENIRLLRQLGIQYDADAWNSYSDASKEQAIDERMIWIMSSSRLSDAEKQTALERANRLAEIEGISPIWDEGSGSDAQQETEPEDESDDDEGGTPPTEPGGTPTPAQEPEPKKKRSEMSSEEKALDKIDRMEKRREAEKQAQEQPDQVPEESETQEVTEMIYNGLVNNNAKSYVENIQAGKSEQQARQALAERVRTNQLQFRMHPEQAEQLLHDSLVKADEQLKALEAEESAAQEQEQTQRTQKEEDYERLVGNPKQFAASWASRPENRNSAQTMIDEFNKVLDEFKESPYMASKSHRTDAANELRRHLPIETKTTGIVHIYKKGVPTQLDDIEGYQITNTGFEGVEFFVHREVSSETEKPDPNGNWMAAEPQTGMKYTTTARGTREQAIDVAFGEIKKHGVEKLNEIIEKELKKLEMFKSQPEPEPTPEQTPEPEPKKKRSEMSAEEKALDKIERMRQRREGENTLKDITAEQQELRDEYVDLTIEDEIEALEEVDDLSDFQQEVLAALKNPDSNPELRDEYVELTIDDEIEALQEMPQPTEFQTDVLNALLAYRDMPPAEVPAEKTSAEILENDIFNILLDGGRIENNEQFFQLADAAFGGRSNYSPKEAYDILDVATIKYLQRVGLGDVDVDAATAKENIREITAIEERLPTQNIQDRQQRQNQQYNTPHAYAYLVNWVANLTGEDVVLEPSAGTGNLAWYADANGAVVLVNEISERRRERLRQAGFTRISGEDSSSRITNLSFMRGVTPSLVVMNPPFSQTGGKKNLSLAGNMIEAAFDTLADGGRLVAIVGGGIRTTDEDAGMHHKSNAYRKFFASMSNKSHIRADIAVAGSVYTKFGTSFNTRLLVFDKPLSNEQVESIYNPNYDGPQPISPDTNYTDLTEIVDVLEGVRDARAERLGSAVSADDGGQSQQRPGEQEGGGISAGGQLPDTPGATERVEPGNVDDRTTQEHSEPGSTSTDTSTGEQSEGGDESTLPEGERDGVSGDGDTTRSSNISPTTSVSVDSTDTAPSGQRYIAGRSTDGDVEQALADAEYIRIPEEHVSPLVETTALAATLSPDVSDIKLTFPQKAAQIITQAQKKGIALAKRATERTIKLYRDAIVDGERVDVEVEYAGGFMFGDDTGVGKTIQILGFILDQIANGHNKHLYISPKAELFAQLVADWTFLGGNQNGIFAANRVKAGDKIDNTTGIAFNTYTTLIQTPNPARRTSTQDRLGQILEYLVGVRPPLSLTSPAFSEHASAGVDLPSFDALLNEYNNLPVGIRESEFTEKYGEEMLAIIKPASEDYNKVRSSREQYERMTTRNERFSEMDKEKGAVSEQEFLEAAKNFTGTIAFDESHYMRTYDTATARMGRKLQKLLPNAKVIYASATPVTRIDEMGYAERLGLWGPGTQFRSHRRFSEDMQRGGFATKEIVAKDMKAMGMYIRRQLDYAGVQTDNIIHQMTPEQEAAYNAAPELWNILREAMDEYFSYFRAQASDLGDGASESLYQLRGQMMRQFWNRNLRFYNAMLDTFKMVSLFEDMKQRLEAGEKVLVQVVDTNEASQNRQLARAAADRTPLDMVKFTPLEILYEYIEHSFPIHERTFEWNSDNQAYDLVIRKETKRDEDGNPILDPDGNEIQEAVINQQSLQRRNQMLEQLQQIDLPGFALDLFHQKLADWGYETAELSGRKEYYVRNTFGKRERIANTDSVKNANKQRFVGDENGSEIKALAFSRQAGTGTNLPALQKGVPINHYVIQSGWNIIVMLQGLGRSMRAKRAEDPRYIITSVNLPAAMRMAGAIVDKLADIGAAVTGQSKSSLGSRLAARDAEANADTDAEADSEQELQTYILGQYGQQALFNLWSELHSGGTIFAPEVERETMVDGNIVVERGVSMSFDMVLTLTRMDSGIDSKTGQLTEDTMPEVKQFLNRLMNIPTYYQRPLGEAFMEQLDGVIAAAIEDDTLDKGADVIEVENADVTQSIILEENEGVETYLVQVDYEEKLKRNTWEWLHNVIHRVPGFEGVAGSFIDVVRNKRSKVIWAIFKGPTYMDASGQQVRMLMRFNQRGGGSVIEETEFTADKYESLTKAEGKLTSDANTSEVFENLSKAEPLWREQDEKQPKTKLENITMVTGALLPVWSKITVDAADTEALARIGISFDEFRQSLKVKRLIMDDGRMIQGRTVPRRYVPELLKQFNVDSTEFGVQAAPKQQKTEQEIWTQTLLETYDEVTLDNGWTLKRRDRAGETYIQIIGDVPSGYDRQRDGIIGEFRTAGGFQYFIQGDDAGFEAFKKLIEEHPPRSITTGSGDSQSTTEIEIGNQQTPEEIPTQDSNQQPGDETPQTTPQATPQTQETQAPQTPQEILNYLQTSKLKNELDTGDSIIFSIGDLEGAEIGFVKPRNYDTAHPFIKSANFRIRINDKEIVKNRHGNNVRVEEAMNEALQNLTLSNVQEVFDKETTPTDTPSTGPIDTPLTNMGINPQEFYSANRDRRTEMLHQAFESNSQRANQADLNAINDYMRSNPSQPTTPTTPAESSSLAQEAREIREENPDLTVKQALDRASTRRLDRDRHDLLPKLSETRAAETELNLEILGIDPANWEIWNNEERQNALEQLFDQWVDADHEMTAEETEAYNFLDNLSRDENLSDYEIASEYKEAIGVVPFPEPKTKRLRNLLNNIYRRKVPVDLIGHTLEDAYEAAVLGQAYRDAEIETTRLFYIKDGKIIGHEGFTLNQSNSTHAPGWAHIATRLDALNADSVVMLHNHPSGKAKFSRADRQITNKLADNLGKRYLGHIIVDSGTYASFWYGEDGRWHYKNEVQLPSEAVGWDTSSELVGNRRVDDPLYRQTDSEEQRAISGYPDRDDLNSWYYDHISTGTTLLELNKDAEMAIVKLGKVLKVPDNWITFAFMGATNNLSAIVEYRDLQNLTEAELISFIDSETKKWGGSSLHIYIGEGDWYQNGHDIAKVFTHNVISHYGVKSVTVAGSDVSLKGGADHPGKFIERDKKYEVVESNFPTLQAEQIIYESGSTTETDKSDDILMDYAAEREMETDTTIVKPREIDELSLEGEGSSYKEKGLRGIIKGIEAFNEDYGRWLGDQVPGIRKAWRNTVGVFESGRRGLEKLRSKPGEKATPFEAAATDLANAESDWLLKISNIRNLTRPALLDEVELVNKLFGKLPSKKRSQFIGDVRFAISDFIEHNRHIEESGVLQGYENPQLIQEVIAVAAKQKEAWKNVLRQSDEDIIRLVKDAMKNGEQLSYASGQPVTPLPIDGHEYDFARDGWVKTKVWSDKLERMVPTKKSERENTYTTEEVFEKAERFYVPHHYGKQHIKTRAERVAKLLRQLNEAMSTGDVTALHKMAGVEKISDSQYYFKLTDETFTSADEVVTRAMEYWTQEDANVQHYINMQIDGTLAQYGHLEFQRRSDDRHYEKDFPLYVKILENAARRMTLIAYFGQEHGVVGKSPRYRVLMQQMMEYADNPEEEALGAIYSALGAKEKINMFEHLYDLGQGRASEDFNIMARWTNSDGQKIDIDVQRLNLSDSQKKELEKVGLLVENNGNWQVRGNNVNARHQTLQNHFAAYSATIAQRLKWFSDTINAMADGPIRQDLDEASKLVSSANAITTMLTLGIRTAAQNLTEIPLMVSGTGLNVGMKGLNFMHDKENAPFVKLLSSALDHGRRYMTETRAEQWYLQSPLSFFAQTEQYSREAGVSIGWMNAQDRIEAYINDQSQKNRHALDDANINAKVLDAFIAANDKMNLESLYKEAQERILHGQMPVGNFQKVGAESASNRWVDIIGQEMQRSAIYMSQTYLKRYNAYSMPKWLADRHPFVRFFMKYKSWGMQNHDLLADRWRKAWRQGRHQGNWTPFLNMAFAAGALTPMGIGAVGFAFTVMQGYEDDDPFHKDLLQVFTAAQSFGMASMVVEGILHSGENPFRLEHNLRGQFTGPAISVATRILSPILTGDFGEAREQILRRVPGTREATYFGLNQIFEEND